MDLNLLGRIAGDVLATCITALDDAGRPAPERRYLHVGEIAYDCEQLVVAWTSLFPGEPDQDLRLQPMRCEFPNTAMLTVSLLRCAPGPSGRPIKPPTPDALQAEALGVMVDATVLAGAVLALAQSGVIGASDEPNSGVMQPQVALSDVATPGPEGGLFGVEFTIAITMV